jgi:NADH dehydrogenase [ubiquinone] 1 alpha subcomplex assembly factor 5
MSHQLFNRNAVKQHRARAARSSGWPNDFLLRDAADRLAERLTEFNRDFPVALDLGAQHGVMDKVLGGRGGIRTLVQCDLSPSMIQGAQGLRLAADEEWLPFADESFDLVMSVGSLHWTNDLPGAMIQIRKILKPGGMFIAALPGYQTLKELRESLEHAETETTGGFSPRVSPFIDVQSAGSLLTRAGFVMPVADTDTVTIHYKDPLTLLYDLRNMGETNALSIGRKQCTRRHVLFGALDYYHRYFTENDGQVPATFEMVTMTGLKSNPA